MTEFFEPGSRTSRLAQSAKVIILRKEVRKAARFPYGYLVTMSQSRQFALGACFPCALRVVTLSASHFRGLTGGVYKAQEHIHRGMPGTGSICGVCGANCACPPSRGPAIPASCRRACSLQSELGCVFWNLLTLARLVSLCMQSGDWLIFAEGTIAAMVAEQKCACPPLGAPSL